MWRKNAFCRSRVIYRVCAGKINLNMAKFLCGKPHAGIQKEEPKKIQPKKMCKEKETTAAAVSEPVSHTLARRCSPSIRPSLSFRLLQRRQTDIESRYRFLGLLRIGWVLGAGWWRSGVFPSTHHSPTALDEGNCVIVCAT